MTRSKFTSGLVACLIVMFTASFAGAEGFTYISKDQLRAELTKPDMVILDVRIPHDWTSSRWKIKGARRESPADVGQWTADFPKDETIVLYCA